MRRALVTGGTGFIGSHLVRRLVRDGLAVHLLCRAGSSLRRLHDVEPALERHVVSLADAAALRALVAAIQPDVVFHLAAATMHAGVAPATDEVFATNLLGTVHLLEACAANAVPRFVNTGDAFEYGPGADAKREEDPCLPDTADGIARLAATLYARAVARRGGLSVVTLRPFSVLGVDDDPRRLVPRIVASVLEGTPLALSHPEIARDFLDVDDLVDLYLCVAAADDETVRGEVFNAGTGRETTIAQLLALVDERTGARSTPRWGAFPVAAHDRFRWQADMTKSFAALPWRPRTPLASSLEKMVAAARELRG